jgi:hypothetical protein
MDASEQPVAHSASDAAGSQLSPDRRRAWGRRIAVPWPELAFLAFFSFYLERLVNTQLVFWNQNDLFLWNRRFACDFFVATGQPCEWLGKLLLQSCHFGWCGAVAIAAVTCLALLSMRAISLRIVPVIAVRRAWIATVLLLVVLHSQYSYDAADTARLSLALMATWIYLITPARGKWTRWAVFVAESVMLYYIAGIASWTFVACCLIYEWMTARRRGLALCLLLSAGAVAITIDSGLSWLNRSVWHLDLHENSYLIPSAWDAWFPAVAFAWCPACLLMMVAFSRRSSTFDSPLPNSEGIAGEESPPSENDSSLFRDEALAWGDKQLSDERSDSPPWTARFLKSAAPIARRSLLAIVATSALLMSPDRVTRKLLEVDLAANDHRWQAVLDAASGVPQALYADYANHDVNQALFHLGRLPEEMFLYPQQRLFCDHGFGSRGRMFSRKAFDVFLELGRVNEAEVIAHNDFEGHPSALFLMRIVEIEIIKGQADAARVYLNVLRDDVCFGTWAETYLRRLDENPDFCEPGLAQIKSRMIIADDILQTQVKQADGSWSISTEGSLRSLLDHDPRNRMAFEYLMAHYLLNRDPAAAVKELPRLNTFAYPHTPLSYEQAALLHAGNQRQKPQITSSGAMINGCPIRRETVSQFLQLYEIDKKCGGFASPAAQVAIQRVLGNTYFAYFFRAEGQDNE